MGFPKHDLAIQANAEYPVQKALKRIITCPMSMCQGRVGQMCSRAVCWKEKGRAFGLTIEALGVRVEPRRRGAPAWRRCPSKASANGASSFSVGCETADMRARKFLKHAARHSYTGAHRHGPRPRYTLTHTCTHTHTHTHTPPPPPQKKKRNAGRFEYGKAQLFHVQCR